MSRSLQHCLTGSVSVIVSPARRPYEYVDPGKEVDIIDFPWQAANRRKRQTKENFMDMTDNRRSFRDESVRMKHSQYICKLSKWNARSEDAKEHAHEISITFWH